MTGGQDTSYGQENERPFQLKKMSGPSLKMPAQGETESCQIAQVADFVPAGGRRALEATRACHPGRP